jgi:hypothetical protein
MYAKSWSFVAIIVVITILISIQVFIFNHQSPFMMESKDDKKHSKCLVIVIGTIRGGEFAWQSAIQNLIDINHADLALFVGVNDFSSSVKSITKNTSLYQRSKYIWTHKEYEDWADAIDLIHGSMWRNTVLPYFSLDGGIFSGIKGLQGSGAIIFMIRWFLSQRLQKEGILEIYERFVITRSDYYYLCPCNIQHLDVDNFLWIPSSEDYGGYTDRFLVVGRQNLLSALNILPPILQYNVSTITKVTKQAVLWNPESLIKYRWDQDGLQVQFFPLVMFTCATVMDTTRWKQRSQVLYPEGVYLKYRTEYFIARESCAADPSKSSPWKFCPSCWVDERDCAYIAAYIYEATALHLGTKESTVLSSMEFTQWLYPSSCRISSEDESNSNRTINHHQLPSDMQFCSECRLKNDTSCFNALMNLVSTEQRTMKDGIQVFHAMEYNRRKCFP